MHISPEDSSRREDKEEGEARPLDAANLNEQRSEHSTNTRTKNKTIVLLETALNIPEYDWAALNEKLASHVRTAMICDEYTTESLAVMIGISEEALQAYLDPESEHEIGTFFLDAREYLNITDEELFEGIDPSYYEEANRALKFALTCVDGSTTIRHLDMNPGRNFSRHFTHTVEKYITALAKKYHLKTREEQSAFFNRTWNLEHYGFSMEDIFECIDKSDFFYFLKNPPRPTAIRCRALMYLLDYCLEGDALEFIPLKKIHQFDRAEISRRIERREAQSKDRYLQSTEWNPKEDEGFHKELSPSFENTEEVRWTDGMQEGGLTEPQEEDINRQVARSIGIYMPELIDGDLPWEDQNQSA